MRFILASASPARLTLLRSAGMSPEVIVSGVDESGVMAGSDAAKVCAELARLKGAAVAERPEAAGALVLGCDSVLDFEGEVWGKPDGPAVAVARWQRMRGRSGVLRTGHYLIDNGTGRQAGAVASTVVRFTDISDAEIQAYVATGEPLEVAGSFTVDGRGGPFVSGVDGDPGTVIGVSLPLLRELLAELGHAVTDLWVTS